MYGSQEKREILPHTTSSSWFSCFSDSAWFCIWMLMCFTKHISSGRSLALTPDLQLLNIDMISTTRQSPDFPVVRLGLKAEGLPLARAQRSPWFAEEVLGGKRLHRLSALEGWAALRFCLLSQTVSIFSAFAFSCFLSLHLSYLSSFFFFFLNPFCSIPM